MIAQLCLFKSVRIPKSRKQYPFTGRTREAKMPPTIQREWTIMLYTMADEAGLRGFANRTLLDIARASGCPDVKTVAQITLSSNNVDPIRRYDFEIYPAKHRKIDRQNGLQYVACKDFNPRRNLKDFLVWGQLQYPAKRYCVVLQGHAWGVDYTLPSLNWTQTKERTKRSNVRIIFGSPRSKNHLSNKEVQATLTKACVRGKFHLLGMDACLMSMAEICCEMSGCADFTVAPEGLGPIQGWPFDPILERLNGRPSMDAADLGSTVLKKYSAKYIDWGGDMKLTISLCDLNYANELMNAMSDLVKLLRSGLKDLRTRMAIIHAREQCAYYRIATYVDLSRYCQLLNREPAIATNSPIHVACSRVQKTLKERFVALVRLQRGRKDSFGLSIYFPKWRTKLGGSKSGNDADEVENPVVIPKLFKVAVERIEAAYLDQTFVRRTGWEKFLLEFIESRIIVHPH